MARWKVWLKCLAQAVWAKVPRALVGLLPFGEHVFDIAADFRERLAKEQPLPERALALAELVTANPAEVQAEAAALAASVAAGQPAEVQRTLTHYLEIAPQVTRQSLRRQDDPTGTTVPPQLSLDDSRSLARFIPPTPPRFQPGDTPASLHGWVLVRRLGAGGFGEVWQVRHPQSKNVHTAVKFCLDPQARNFLAHEKQVVDQVMSLGALPGIVPLRDFDVESDPPYLKYDYVEGGDLLGQARNFFGGRATQAIRVLAEIVSHFHRLDPPVVHRDLKPSNILVQTLPGGKIQLRIADFGIGGTASKWALDQDRIRTLPSAALPIALLGSHTALYASKQQKAGCKPDPRDDVFALGVLWYQLLIGDLTSERPSGNWRKKVLALGLSEELLDLLGGCCDDDPAERPANAAALAEQLTAAPAPHRKKVEEVKGEEEKQPEKKKPEPTWADVAEQKRQERQARHDQARKYEQQGLYAEAVRELEKLTEDRRERPLYEALVQRRDEIPALEKEIREATQNDRLTSRHRTLILRLKELQPFRAPNLDRLLKLVPDLPAKFTNTSLQMPFVPVPPGTFWMGGGGGQPGNQQVTITTPFYLGVYPVTQGQWQALMGNNPSYFSRTGGGAAHVEGISDADLRLFPVEQVSFDDAREFLKRLNARGKDGEWTYRLPTEAEWEYSCRGGAVSQEECSYHFYLDRPSNSLSSTQANFDGNHPEGGAAKGPRLERTSMVGSYKPNWLGIFDMHGNVCEWCNDASGWGRVVRGGSWSHTGSNCRAAERNIGAPADRSYFRGFRLVRFPSGS